MCHFLMGISAKYLKDAKDRKSCPSVSFSFLFKMLSLLLDPLCTSSSKLDIPQWFENKK